ERKSAPARAGVQRHHSIAPTTLPDRNCCSSKPQTSNYGRSCQQHRHLARLASSHAVLASGPSPSFCLQTCCLRTWKKLKSGIGDLDCIGGCGMKHQAPGEKPIPLKETKQKPTFLWQYSP